MAAGDSDSEAEEAVPSPNTDNDDLFSDWAKQAPSKFKKLSAAAQKRNSHEEIVKEGLAHRAKQAKWEAWAPLVAKAKETANASALHASAAAAPPPEEPADAAPAPTDVDECFTGPWAAEGGGAAPPDAFSADVVLLACRTSGACSEPVARDLFRCLTRCEGEALRAASVAWGVLLGGPPSTLTAWTPIADRVTHTHLLPRLGPPVTVAVAWVPTPADVLTAFKALGYHAPTGGAASSAAAAPPPSLPDRLRALASLVRSLATPPSPGGGRRLGWSPGDVRATIVHCLRAARSPAAAPAAGALAAAADACVESLTDGEWAAQMPVLVSGLSAAGPTDAWRLAAASLLTGVRGAAVRRGVATRLLAGGGGGSDDDGEAALGSLERAARPFKGSKQNRVGDWPLVTTLRLAAAAFAVDAGATGLTAQLVRRLMAALNAVKCGLNPEVLDPANNVALHVAYDAYYDVQPSEGGASDADDG